MFLNYILTWFRTQNRQKIYTLLNLFGLAFGLACVIIIFLYIQYEFSYDKQHINKDRIYKIVYEINRTGSGYMGSKRYAVTPAPMAPALMEEFPEIEAATRLTNWSNVLIRSGDKTFLENRWVWADKYIFDVFTFPLVLGDEKTALNNLYSVVVSENMAKKYFGSENPVGKILNYNNEKDFTVTGVMKNIPENSHIKGDFLATFETLGEVGQTLDQWGNNSYSTFFLLQKDHNHHDLEKKYPAFIETKYKNYDWWKKEEANRYYHQKLTDIHLKADTIFNFGPVNDIKYIYIFTAIALFILLIACMNYMNLSTARAAKRAKEVGIRKVVGAQRSQLTWQFLSESLILTFVSLIFALGIVYLLLPVFNTLMEREITINLFDNFSFLLILIGIGLGVGLISGSYPAFFMSNFKPVTSLRKRSFSKGKTAVFRNVLVVVQFAISIFLIISTIVISDQLSYIRNKKLGFTKDHIIIVNMRDKAVREKTEVVKQELLKHSGIIGVTFSSSLPMRVSSRTFLRYEGSPDPENDRLQTYFANVDYDFFDVFEMEIVAGRKFSPEIDKATNKYIINETAVKQLGWTDPIGKNYGREDRMGPVVGVVKDFHYANFHLPMEPVTFFLDPGRGYNMSIKINSENIKSSIAAIKKVWNTFSNGYPFEYQFMDEEYDNMYKTEIRLGKTFSYFAILAIVICCLGLFGLASFTTEQRTKEIGIRKVLGGTTSSIVSMLLKQFTKWVFLANFIAWPLAWYAMDKWLQDFAYRIDIGWGMFAAAAVMALLIAILTVCYQAVKAAMANPVDSLQYE